MYKVVYVNVCSHVKHISSRPIAIFRSRVQFLQKSCAMAEGDGVLDAYHQSFEQSLSVWGEEHCGTHPVMLRGRMSTTPRYRQVWHVWFTMVGAVALAVSGLNSLVFTQGAGGAPAAQGQTPASEPATVR